MLIVQNSLMELMEKMNSSKPRFIRCIKPNAEKLPDSFISSYVQKQLHYAGVMETVRLRQCGFPTRLSFDDFNKRYMYTASDSITTDILYMIFCL